MFHCTLDVSLNFMFHLLFQSPLTYATRSKMSFQFGTVYVALRTMHTSVLFFLIHILCLPKCNVRNTRYTVKFTSECFACRRGCIELGCRGTDNGLLFFIRERHFTSSKFPFLSANFSFRLSNFRSQNSGLDQFQTKHKKSLKN